MKTKLNPELTKQICEYIKQGLYLKDACALCDISHQTYYNWLDRADMGEKLYIEFVEATKRAEAEDKAARIADAQVKAVKRNSWEENWRYLEARYPQQYAKHEVIHNTNQAEGMRAITALVKEIKAGSKMIESDVIEGEVKVLSDGSQGNGTDG